MNKKLHIAGNKINCLLTSLNRKVNFFCEEQNRFGLFKRRRIQTSCLELKQAANGLSKEELTALLFECMRPTKLGPWDASGRVTIYF